MAALLLHGSGSVPARADEFDVLRLKWVDMLTGGSGYDPGDPGIRSAVNSITNTANTYWRSLNTASDRDHLWDDAARTNVSADINTNYSRLRAMALAYRTTGSILQGSADLLADTLRGLDWMYANRYNETKRIYDNWWHFEIGSPTALVDIVALLYDRLSPSQLDNYMRTVEKFTPSATTPAPGGSTGTFTGANRMSKIVVVTIRGLIVKDEAKLRAARDAFSNLFEYVTRGDGFYEDGSFVQHTGHAYTGSYGSVLIADLSNILTLLNGPNALDEEGSSWRVIDPDLANVYRWVYDAYEPLIYRGGMMAMTQGRAISRSSTSEHGTGHAIMHSIARISQFAPAEDRARMRSMLRYWAESDTARSFVGAAPLPAKALAQDIISHPAVGSRGELRGNRVFANMGRVVHLGRGFGIGLSLSSSRIYTYESINGENLRGWHTGDGMTYLYNGDLTHYSDAFWPTANPRRLPGTTVDATQPRANASGQSRPTGSNWAGGASLGRYGVAGMQLRGWNSTLQANKSWFMFDDEVVCLGSGITSTDNRPIETTVEHRLIDERAGENAFAILGIAQPGTPSWLEPAGNAVWAHLSGRNGSTIGYFFPGTAAVNSLRESRTGAWSEINTGGPTAPITRHYLTLWFDHGANPVNATYAYVLLPGWTVSAVADYSRRPSIVVLENSPAAQAVRQTSLGVIGINAWTDAGASAGGITVNGKASVIVQDSGGFVDLAVSDPTHANIGSIALEIAATARHLVSADPGVTVTALAPAIRLTIDVNSARGRTFRARLATAEPKPPATLSNLSTRAYLSGADANLIGGFVVHGTGTKRMIVRAVGPTLSRLGVADALPNPRLQLTTQDGRQLAENDDWSTAPNAAELAARFPTVGAFALPTGSRDAALLVDLPAGLYSAIVSSAEAAGSGVVLVEIYDPAPAVEPRLINLSSRLFAGTGNQTAIVGFALAGEAQRRVLVRAAGPALAAFQIADRLPNPLLRVVDSMAVIIEQNDNWGGSPLADEIDNLGMQVGAFDFDVGSRDSAVMMALSPGTYTALVGDTTGAVGSTVVEVYAAP